MGKVTLIDTSKRKQTSRVAVNQSRVKAWRQCHRQHWYKFEEMLVRKRKKRPFMFGGIVHEMLEAYANGQDPWKVYNDQVASQRKLFQSEIELYGNIAEDLKYIMEEYFRFWKQHKEKRLNYIAIGNQKAEHVFEIELERGLIWKGKADSFAKTPNQLIWLVEHKTFNKEWSEDERWRNLQSLTYRRAAKLMGWPVPDGTLWDYIHSKAPTRPKLLKAGSVSTAAIVTLPAVVEDFRVANKLTRSAVADIMEKAEECRHKYFQRVFTPANEAIEEKVFQDFVETVYEIAEDHDRKKARNIGKHCGWCDYEAICRTDLTDGDIDFVKEREYVIDTETVKPDSASGEA
jgi:hypothetical protein